MKLPSWFSPPASIWLFPKQPVLFLLYVLPELCYVYVSKIV